MSRILPILTLAVLVLPTASRGQTPPGDHYLCYKASQSKGETPLQTTAKLLVDQLQDQSYDVKKVVSLCNPATKTHNGVTTSPQFPAVHQQGYQIKLPKGAAKFVPSNHTVFDQFGSLQLTVKSPDSLLVRTAKTVLGSTLTSCKLDSGCSAGLSCIGGACIDPAFPTPPADNVGVDNFECYKVAIQKGTPKFQPIVGGLVQVTDQFGGPLEVEITKPTKICTPVDKAGENPGAETHPGHLMCYQVKLTKTDPAQPKFAKTRVAVANTNFPDTRLDAKSIAELCVPAFKDVVPTPSPTATPSPTPTVCSACPADYWDVDGNPLTGTCGCEYHCHQTSTSSDPIDPNFTDDNCDGSDGVTAQCVYVSTGQGDDNSGTGTRQSPLKTIAAAIQKAQASAVAGVCLSGEVYNESVAMVSGVSVYGGFDQNDADFKFRRSASVTTTVNAPGVVFDAPQIDQETHIEGITINAQAAAPAGASTYGVRLSGGTGQLFVRYNVIQAAAGNGGDAGVDGSANPSAQAAAGNNGQDGCTSCSTNGAGGPPPSCTEFGGKGGNGGFDSGNGAAGSPGSGSASGGSAGISSGMCSTFGAPKSGPGGPGSTGSGGAQGTPGSGGAALGSVSAGYELAVGTGGLAGDNGKGGGGGGGGGGGAANLCNFGICANTCNADKGGGGGSGGCGGLGGDRGLGGGGGGGSFGVFAATGTIAVTSNDITTHNGGNGGKGGNGAAGQSGGAGGTGGAAADDAGAGGDGRSGGTGGAGGPGGGGGGGPSACLGYASSVVLTFSTNTCTGGLPGSGGDGGTNPTGGVASAGQAGVASSSLQIN